MAIETTRKPEELDAQALEAYRQTLRGRLVGRADPDYDEARKVYNGMIDRRPALIAYCAGAVDVIASVNFAREQGLLLAIRSGGHNGPGLGVCDDGLVIDLSRMKGIRVDPVARMVRVEAGCTIGDIDHATYPFGLAVPSGTVSTTGVGGLTLGGGIGHLTRAYGLSIDNLLEVDMVLADGRYVVANAEEHPDLFWAVRGGGGNFGVVTSFLFQLRPAGRIYGGVMAWPLARADEVLRWYREFLPQAPDELTGSVAFLTVPPVPPFPEAFHNHRAVAIIWCYTGPMERAEEIFAPIRSRLAPALDWTAPMPFPALNSMFDALLPPGLQWYWKSDFFSGLPDEAIAAHIEHAGRAPVGLSQTHVYPISGAAGRISKDATAWDHREAQWAAVIVGISPDPADKASIMTWAREYWSALHPYALGGAYLNFMMDEGSEQVRASYRGQYERLARIKGKYDPANLFRVNQNIAPR